MHRFSNSWALAKRSAAVLRAHKALVVLPILAAVTAMLVAAAFAALGFVAGGGASALRGNATLAIGPLVWVFVFLGYFAEAVVVVYFMAVLVAAADCALRGDPVALGAAFSSANARLSRVVQWAFIVATVNVVLSTVRNRGALGGLVSRAMGGGWSVLTFLAVPVIVHDDVGPIKAVKRSGALLRQTWGENLIGQFGFGALGALAVVPAIALIVLGAWTGSVAAFVPLVVVAFVWIFAVAMVIQALTGIYRAALYRYAVDGAVPAAFAGAALAPAIEANATNATSSE